MNMDERIKKINELYHKSQTSGLNEEEKALQAKLRHEYIDSIRGALRSQLDNIDIKMADSAEKLRDKYKKSIDEIFREEFRNVR